jgi:DNA uptake protein ComE-like DNA-binding protein
MTLSHRKLVQKVASLVGLFALSALALVGCAAEPAATATSISAATTGDTDLAPECDGIIDYINEATLQDLDAYLPSNVASAIVARRATQPFVDIEDISSVSGIAQARLEQITDRARAEAHIDATCAGVYEELAVSADDAAKILTYTNSASEAALWNDVRFEPNTVAPLLVDLRPFSTLAALVAVYGVGPSTFRSLRDAAVVDDFDDLADRVNDVHRDASLRTSFNWYSIAGEQPGQQAGMLCFGVPADLVNSYGGQMRPDLATGAEVLSVVTGTVSYADRYHEVGDSTAGLDHLEAKVSGQTFFGCYLEFQPNPWCGVNRAFFVNKDTGYRVLAETSWCE